MVTRTFNVVQYRQYELSDAPSWKTSGFRGLPSFCDCVSTLLCAQYNPKAENGLSSLLPWWDESLELAVGGHRWRQSKRPRKGCWGALRPKAGTHPLQGHSSAVSSTVRCVGLQSMACSNNASGHTASFRGIIADRHMVFWGRGGGVRNTDFTWGWSGH